jgi:hypothetical protein
VAEKDKKGDYDADQQQQREQRQSIRPDVSQQTANLMAALLQQLQRQMRLGTLNNSSSIDETQVRNASFAGAAFKMIDDSLTNLSPFSMAIEAASETEGPASGGQDITLTGSSFMPDVSVVFGAREATAVSVISASEITLKTPPGSGTVPVAVRSSFAGEASREAFYTYR